MFDCAWVYSLSYVKRNMYVNNVGSNYDVTTKCPASVINYYITDNNRVAEDNFSFHNLLTINGLYYWIGDQ